MPRQFEEPQIGAGDRLRDYVVTHPSYGQVMVSKVSGQKFLYGSDFEHHNWVEVRIYESELDRSLAHDWPHQRKCIAEFSLSEAQWARFVSSFSDGSGTQCTLNYVRDVGHIPEIPRATDRHKQFSDEVMERLDKAEDSLDELAKAIDAAALSKASKEKLRSLLINVANNLSPNVAYVGKCFAEHVERTTEHAKIEVNAYIENRIRAAGMQAIASELPIQLEAGDESQVLPGQE